ncbi:MAG: hypothetical protein FD138_1817 [Planctomycetota bacterium]|nr:MAG: hypothetical protein FD138_1817 [Planctomycetota bacterium]
MRDASIVRCPRAVRVGLGGGRRQEAGDTFRFRGENLKLDTPFGGGLAMQRSGGDELAAFDEVCWDSDFDDRWGLHAETRGLDGRSVWMLAEQRGVEANVALSLRDRDFVLGIRVVRRSAFLSRSDRATLSDRATNQRSAERGELSEQRRIRTVLRLWWSRLQQFLNVVRELRFLGSGRGLPLRQH